MTEGNEGNLNNQGTGDQTANTQNASTVERPAWSAQLPDKFKSHESVPQYKTIGDLFEHTLDLEGKVKNAVSIPGENATPEERATFYSKLGRPETPDKYQFDKIEAPEWFQHDSEEEIQNFRKWAHGYGLPQKAAAGLYKDIVTARLEEAKELQAILVEHETESENFLKDLWKTDYDANKELSVRGLENSAKSLLGEERGLKFVKFLRDSHLTNDHNFIQYFHAIGRVMDSDKTAFGTGDTSQGTGSKYIQIDKAGNPMLDFDKTPSMKNSP